MGLTFGLSPQWKKPVNTKIHTVHVVNPSSSHTVNTTPTQNCAFSAAVSHVSFEAVRKPPEAAGKSCWIFTDIIPIVTCFYTHTVPSQRTQKALNIKIFWQTTGNISTPVTDSPLLVHHSSIVVCINELLGGFLWAHYVHWLKPGSFKCKFRSVMVLSI